MKNIVLSLLSLLVLSACLSSGDSAWERSAPPQEAAAAPGSLDLRGQWMGDPALEPQMNTQAADASVTHYPLPPAQQQGNMFQAPLAVPQSPVKVAILVPLSGKNAEVGEALVNAAQLAVFDVGADSFELMPRDTGGTPAGAAQAAQSALHEGAQLILGPLFADEVRAAAPIAAAAGVNMVAFTTDWKLAGGNTFVMGFMPFGQVQRVVGFAAARGIKRIGVLAPQTEYGNAVINAYHSAAQAAGISTIDMLRFQPGGANLSGPVQNFARYDARRMTDGTFSPPPFDAVFFPVAGSDAQTISNLLSYYELDPSRVRRLGTGLWDDGALAREQNLAGGWFAAPDPAARRTFESRYRDSYGVAPPRLASLGYDATALAAVLARAAQNSGGRPAFDRSALVNPNGFSGIDGIFRFHSNGIAERGLAVLEMRGGQITVIDPAPRTFQQAPQ